MIETRRLEWAGGNGGRAGVAAGGGGSSCCTSFSRNPPRWETKSWERRDRADPDAEDRLLLLRLLRLPRRPLQEVGAKSDGCMPGCCVGALPPPPRRGGVRGLVAVPVPVLLVLVPTLAAAARANPRPPLSM